MKRSIVIFCCVRVCLMAQEASSGFELRTTLSTEGIYSQKLVASPRSGSPVTAGFRDILYPTWKLNEHWAVAGALQVHSRPYFVEQFSTQGYGVKTDVLQAHVSYSRMAKDRSLVVRVGQLSSSFGSFLLRYDDAENPLVDMPVTYGYYYKPITTYGLAGAQVDATAGKLDVRAQLTNSSPANRRSLFDKDQYVNWSGGAGYTIAQGFRIGASAYRGPYLHRQYMYYLPGEARPRDLSSTGYGLDVQWARGPWNAYGEMQRFVKPYRAMPTFRQHGGYGEVRRVIHPRWYVAARLGYLRASQGPGSNVYETAVGFRPNRYQLAKIGYQRVQVSSNGSMPANTLVVQLVTSFRMVAIARD